MNVINVSNELESHEETVMLQAHFDSVERMGIYRVD